jgi:hypothetical protein
MTVQKKRLARGREAKMVLQQERAKRRPRSDHEHAISVIFE